MESKDGLTAEFMQSIFRDGVIGYKEFRSWLAATFESYAAVRDPAIDAMIDDVARRRMRPELPETTTDPDVDVDGLPRGGA